MSEDSPRVSEFEFRGNANITYPGHQHPERPGVLQADPGEVIDFGNASPPGDGLWYDVSSGEPFLPLSQGVEGAAPAQGDAEDPEG